MPETIPEMKYRLKYKSENWLIWDVQKYNNYPNSSFYEELYPKLQQKIP